MTALVRLFACLLLASAVPALSAEPEVKVAVAQSGSVFVVDADIDFPYPVRTVWDVLTDFDHMAGIVSNLRSSKISRRKGNTVVVQQEGTARFGPLSYTFLSERKVRMEPMKRIVVWQIAGQAKRFESEADLAESNRGTSIHYHAEIEPDSLLARLFGAIFIQHEVEEQFHALAGEMEKRQRL